MSTESDTQDVELISTKYQVPPVPASVLPRERLLERLDDRSTPVILVRAPAGYGKSTLLEQWANAGSVPLAWVQLDRAEADPVLFWRYVLAAIRTIEPGFAAEAYREAWGAAPRVEAVVVPKLLNALSERAEPLRLVLDDFHRLGASPVDAQLGVLLQHIPRSLTLVIASRVDPDLPLARLRTRGLLRVIDADELCLTLDESIEAVAAYDAARGADEARAIHARTEGWPAGVYLASQSGAAFPPAGLTTHIRDYVAEEMLEALPDEDRRFMRATSILSSLDPSLCDAVTGTVGSGARLRRLAAANLMLVRLDQSGDDFRYHHLLQSLLRSELQATEDADYVRELHRRAYEWHLARDQFSLALEQAIDADEKDKAAAIVCSRWFGYMLGGQVLTARRWLEYFSESDYMAFPPLASAAAMIHAYVGEATKTRRLARLAMSLEYEGESLDGSCCWESSIHILHAATCLDGPEALRPHAERALELEPELSPWRPGLLSALGYVRLNQTDDRRYDALLLEAAETRTGPPSIAAHAFGVLALVQSWRGAWGSAREYARLAIDGIERAGIHNIVLSGPAYAVSARVATKEGDTDEALAALRSAEQSAQRGSEALPFNSMVLCGAIAEAWLELGQHDRARDYAERALGFLAVMKEGGRAADRLDRVIRRINEVGEGVAGPAASAPALLSTRELQILGLLRAGLTLDEIGERLYITRNTVKTHTGRAYRKLLAHDRDEAVARALELDLL